ncbi:inter-alpha-trypsin inhibitor heavy chain H4-like [Coccinella septempunctata]|uniref:inter-alpha-trypsin inhibitor heavy chain H4-like n=1 Tax=Coccinella septempunctata TaxID=41139 RepID=UPI001D068A81|nr:inter-alpha-trypsin inhibitor heavy chain H4-like [Coccinella septempunctata]
MKFEIILGLIHLYSVFGASFSTKSWVTLSPDASFAEKFPSDEGEKIPEIYSMKVNTNVTNRFASSLVTSKVKNLNMNPQEVTFSFVLPDTAYITGFIMEIDGKKYEAYIQEKEKAKKTYDEAVSSGFAAGHVAVNARDSNKFTVSVNIMPESKATFYLTYEELLIRQKGLYDIIVNLHPGQPVKDMEVQVNINETRSLTSVTTPSIRSGNELSKTNEIIDPKAEIERIGNNAARIIFKPDIIKQKELAKEIGTEEENGFAGQFIVQYDVERDPHGGELLFADGYFVHFFAPKDAKPEPKQISFVLDTSGSMWGRKMDQLKAAMKNILDQLNMEDSFNLIDFNSVVNVWNVSKGEVQYQEGETYPYFPHVKKPSADAQVLPEPFEVSGKTIEKAKKIVDSFRASGGTNIDAALQIVLKLHKNNKQKDKRQPMIFFLTDGEATDGETGSDAILAKVSEANDGIPIISISFGSRADKKFLEKLSLKNNGFARHIYEGADADLQLKSFYELISSPLFNKIKFTYVSENVTELTKTEFPILFNGSELIVAGKYKTPALDPGFSPSNSVMDSFGVLPVISCFSGPTSIEFKPTLVRPIGSLEKHWAYLTLKQILKEREASDKNDGLTKKALDLALKYSFVTPVSSLVVVKPNDTKTATDLEDASKGSGQSGVYPKSYKTSSFIIGGRAPTNYGSVSYDLMVARTGNLGFSAYNLRGPSFQFPPAQPAPFDLNSYHTAFTTPAPIRTTEKPTPDTEDDIIKKMKKELPWFGAIYNAENGTISLPQGVFAIGKADQIIEPHPECPKTPTNGIGHCVLLSKCPQIYHLLNPITTYNRFFCSLGKFAGVCCPTNSGNERK